jgi:hypothetical protein
MPNNSRNIVQHTCCWQLEPNRYVRHTIEWYFFCIAYDTNKHPRDVCPRVRTCAHTSSMRVCYEPRAAHLPWSWLVF